MSQLSILKGQSQSFNIAVARNGAPVDLTAALLKFTAKLDPSDPDDDAVFIKTIGSGITVTNAALGLATVSILSSDTATTLPGDVLLFYTLQLDVGFGWELVDDGTIQLTTDTTPNEYITVADIRAAGLQDPPFTDEQIRASIKLWQKLIERVTRQWFYPLPLEIICDGTDSDSLFLGVPIISIDELRLNGDPVALDKRYYHAYTSRAWPDDRTNPRIHLVDTRFYETDIYTAPMRDGQMRFRVGKQNQYIRGVFGYVEADGSTPEPIKYALKKLVIQKLTTPLYVAPGSSPMSPPPLVSGIVTEEWTDGHKIKYAQAGGEVRPRAPGLTGITGDQEILDILRLYRAPIGVASPSNPSYR